MTRTILTIFVSLFSFISLPACLFAPEVERPQVEIPTDVTSARRATIQRDEHQVPHIVAEDIESLFFAWGYTQAADRLWQMDYLHRVGLGRTAEVYGKKSVRLDFFVRGLRIPAKGAELARKLETTEEGRLMKHFVWGVNHYINEHPDDLPYQFEDYGIKPLPWSIEASALVALLQSLDMTKRTLITDMQAAVARNNLGETRYDEMLAPEAALAAFESTIIKEHELSDAQANGPTPVWNTEQPVDTGIIERDTIGGGSNAWAIGASRTEAGHPILANDTHLPLRNPAFWHEVHVTLKNGEIDAYGFGVPGFPTLAAGHNGHVAWGVTLGYGNAMDLVAYKRGSKEDTYIADDGSERTLETIRPRVHVKMGPFYIPVFWQTFQVSDDGMVYDVALEDVDDQVHLVKWTALEIESFGVGTALGFLKARTAKEFDAATAQWELPSFNIVWADKHGEIGFRQVGLMAKRKSGRLGIVPTDVPDARWSGIVRSSELPSLMNPERDYIVAANNLPTANAQYGDTYLGNGFRRGYRGHRAEELILEDPKLSFEEVRAIQLDTFVPAAKILLPLMLKALGDLPQGDVPLRARELLAGWDYRADVDQAAPTLFRVWEKKLGRELFTNDNVYPSIDGVWRVLSGKINPGAAEPLPDVVLKTFYDACLKLETDLGAPDATFSNWHWGLYHTVTIRNLAGDERWDLAPFGVEGDAETLNQASHNGDGPFDVRSAASFRLIVELSDPVRGFGVFPGQNIDSSNKENISGVALWRQGELRKQYYTPEEIKAHRVSEKVLTW